MATVEAPMSRRQCSCVGVSLLLVSAVASTAAAADKSTPERSLGTDGFVAYHAGRYDEANEKLSQALSTAGVPTVALVLARANAKLNHWVKATELYWLASRLTRKTAADIPRLQVQYQAEKERRELLLRVPRLTIEVRGEDLEAVQISLDSEPVPKALFGTNQLIDPGRHVISAVRAGQVITFELNVLEGQHRTATLHFAQQPRAHSTEETLPRIVSTTKRWAQSPPISSPTPTPNGDPLGLGAGPSTSAMATGALDDDPLSLGAAPSTSAMATAAFDDDPLGLA